MNMFILGAAESYSTVGIIIWIIVIGLAIYAIKSIGRFAFGVVVLIAMLFFSVFMLDNFTHHDLRRYIDLRPYDETLEDPQGKAEELAGKGSEIGSDVVGRVDEVGTTLDDELGISRVEDSKEWGSEDEVEEKDSSKESEKESSKEKDSSKDTEDETEDIKESTITAEGSFTITYAEISKLLKTDLEELSKQDKAIITSMSPTLKITLDGEKISVTNKETDDGYLTITLK